MNQNKKTASSKTKRIEAAKKKAKIAKRQKWLPRIEGIIIAVLCVAFAIHLCYDYGILTVKTKGSMTMGDYSTIEIAAEDVEVTDDTVDSAIEYFVENYAETEEETEGTIEDGDTVTIDYTGYYSVDGEKGEEFDGGSDEGYELEIGSDTFIDGFEDGLIGAEIGDTVTLALTFPDDYDDEDMAGVDVIFDVTISNRVVTVTPELTDDFVAENSEEYWGDQVDTVEDLEEYVYNYYYESYLNSAILTALTELQEVESYDEDDYELLKESSIELLETYASYYGYDSGDELAELYGYDDAESYAEDDAEYYLSEIMLFDYLYKDLGLSDPTNKEIEEMLEEYMEENGYDDYTTDEFIEESGEAWYLTFKKIDCREDQLYEALAEYVVIVDDTESGDATESGDSE